MPQGVKLTEKERRDLEYKEQVYKLAVERKKQLGGCPLCFLLGVFPCCAEGGGLLHQLAAAPAGCCTSWLLHQLAAEHKEQWMCARLWCASGGEGRGAGCWPSWAWPDSL